MTNKIYAIVAAVLLVFIAWGGFCNYLQNNAYKTTVEKTVNTATGCETRIYHVSYAQNQKYGDSDKAIQATGMKPDRILDYCEVMVKN